MKFEFAVNDEAFAEQHRTRLHELLNGVLTQHLAVLADNEIKSTVVIRRGIAGDVVKKTYEDQERRRAEHIRTFGNEAGFRP
jgi:hypothetical protein